MDPPLRRHRAANVVAIPRPSSDTRVARRTRWCRIRLARSQGHRSIRSTNSPRHRCRRRHWAWCLRRRCRSATSAGTATVPAAPSRHVLPVSPRAVEDADAQAGGALQDRVDALHVGERRLILAVRPAVADHRDPIADHRVEYGLELRPSRSTARRTRRCRRRARWSATYRCRAGLPLRQRQASRRR